jgi:hypothetical protein
MLCGRVLYGDPPPAKRWSEKVGLQTRVAGAVVHPVELKLVRNALLSVFLLVWSCGPPGCRFFKALFSETPILYAPKPRVPAHSERQTCSRPPNGSMS